MKQSNLQKQLLGKAGEDFASSFLRTKGFHIIERNFKIRYGELDIIALDGDTLVFVEVKTRAGDEYGLPEESVTPKKIREVVRTSRVYKYLHPDLPDDMRIDVVAVDLTPQHTLIGIRHIPNITQ